MTEAVDAICMACADESCDFKPMRFQRRPLGPQDVLIDMKYCGVCHSDLHTAANHMAGVGRVTSYPCTPGHELAGICSAVGSEVSKIKVGDQVGVGCLVDSCGDCERCKEGQENKCKQSVSTYNGADQSGRAASHPPGQKTIGGYCTKMVVNERFAILIPPDYPLDCAGPVMCAGITVYDPLKAQGAKQGTRVGVIGLGGLGLMGIKLAKALGCKVTAISRSKTKEALAKQSGAELFVVSEDAESMLEAAESLDLILNTIPTSHDWGVYQALLDADGRQVLLGAHAGTAAAMFAKRVKPQMSVTNSLIGGILNTQEVIDLCAREKIYPDIEVVPVQKLGEVYTALDAANDTGKRYVLDLEGSLNDKAFDSCTAPPPNLGPNTTNLAYPSVIYEFMRMVIWY